MSSCLAAGPAQRPPRAGRRLVPEHGSSKLTAIRWQLAQTVNAHLDEIGEPKEGFGGAARVGDIRARKFDRFDRLAAEEVSPVRPERIVAALQETLPEDAVIVSDPGTSCPYLSAFYRQSKPGRQFITNRAHGALGYSLGAALGAWFGRPSSRPVAIMGDGSFGFACGELETVVRTGAPVLIVVLTNSAFGWIRASQHADFGARYHNVDFSTTDHAAIAADYGLKSWRVGDPRELRDVLTRAVRHDGPALVDIECQALEEAEAPVRRWMG